MSQVADNADIYANQRIGIFFPGIIPALDGQCVSLVKWFMAEMSAVPNPQAARGDARYVGKTLVSQGHAIEVPYADRRRGDIITYENGTYGHIGIVLSGNRTFEQNVNWAGVPSRLIVDGEESWTVYGSRIGSLTEGWRRDQHIYRLKTYQEKGEEEVFTQEMYNSIKPIFTTFGVTPPPAGIAVGFPVAAAIGALLNSPEWQNLVKSRTLMTKDSLTRLHKLAMGVDPGPLYIGSFVGKLLDPAMKQLEGDPNRLNNKPGTAPATELKSGIYEVK